MGRERDKDEKRADKRARFVLGFHQEASKIDDDWQDRQIGIKTEIEIETDSEDRNGDREWRDER